jgi:hypothetical protein
VTEEEEDADFRAWEAALAERSRRRAEIEASVEARRAELKAQRRAAQEAERARLQPALDFVKRKMGWNDGTKT